MVLLVAGWERGAAGPEGPGPDWGPRAEEGEAGCVWLRCAVLPKAVQGAAWRAQRWGEASQLSNL